MTSIIIIIFIVLLLLIASLFLLKNSPKTLLDFGQRFHSYDISADSIDVSLFKPAVDISTLLIRNSQGDTLLSVGELVLSSQWRSLLFSEEKALFTTLKNGTAEIEHITQALPKGTEQEQSKNPVTTESSEPLDIHSLLQISRLSLQNIRINAPDNRQIDILELTSLPASTNDKVGFNFSLHYQQADLSIPLKGQLSSTAVQNKTSQLHLHLPELDISRLTAVQNATENSPSSNSTNNPASPSAAAIGTPEQAFDWSPLQQLAPLDFTLQLDKVALAQGDVSQLESRLILSNESAKKDTLLIHYTQSSELDVDINEDFHFTGPFTIETQWQTLGAITTEADVDGKTTVSLADNTITLDGRLNLNHLDNQTLSVNLALEEFPFTTSPSTAQIKQQIAPYLPFSVETKVQMANKQLSLIDLVLKAGASDLSGQLALGLQEDLTSLEKIEFDLNSTQIIIPKKAEPTVANTVEPADKLEPTVGSEEIKISKEDKLFNDDLIDTRFLDTINTKGQLAISKVVYGDRLLLSGLTSTLVLEDKTLSLKSQIDDFAQGKIITDINLNGSGKELQLATKGSISELLLESLAFLPEGEFTGGKTDVDFALTSTGNSTETLASNLQGNLLVFSREGTIANNSFELISSDILLKLVNTINPFYKKSTNTQLECAVVKSNIVDGKMKFTNSIAIKTSKMIIIADGTINLATERMNLGINPKTRSGVGVDIASLAKFVAIKGPLTKPSVGVSAKGSLKSALSIGAAVSTGGLSLIASNLADKTLSGDACKNAHNAFTKKLVIDN